MRHARHSAGWPLQLGGDRRLVLGRQGFAHGLILAGACDRATRR